MRCPGGEEKENETYGEEADALARRRRLWIPKEVVLTSMSEENCPTMSSMGSRTSPAETVTPNPPGWRANLVSSANETAASSVRTAP